MKILAPVDMSRRDGITGPYVARAARAYDASVAVVMAVPLTSTLIPGRVAEAEAYVQVLADSLRDEGVAADGFVRRGSASSAITSLAAEQRADLIILTTRGRTGIGKFALGSVATDILAQCATPVLILHESEEGAALTEEVRLQSSYTATVLWNKQARGLITKEDVEGELTRLASSGLDKDVLFATYESLRQGGNVVELLDIDFQMRTLSRFLPDEADSSETEPPASRRVA